MWSCLNLNTLQLFISVEDFFFSLDLFNFAFGCTFALAGASLQIEHEKINYKVLGKAVSSAIE